MKKLGYALILTIIAVVVVFGLYWAWKYYGLPEWSAYRGYKPIEERAERALAFARNHHMNEHYALFVDYSLPSGTPRLFVWDFKKQKIIVSSYVMHGSGGGSTDKRPLFSNEPGSECSSLGRFLVTKRHGSTVKYSYRLWGMDYDNHTAYDRGLMIHGSSWLDKWCWKEYIPLHRESCQGCVTVSKKEMKFLWRLQIGNLTLDGGKSDFAPGKPPLSSEETHGLLRPRLRLIFQRTKVLCIFKFSDILDALLESH